MSESSAFPRLRLRRAGRLLDLPWELRLAEWPASLGFRALPIAENVTDELPALAVDDLVD